MQIILQCQPLSVVVAVIPAGSREGGRLRDGETVLVLGVGVGVGDAEGLGYPHKGRDVG